MEHGEIYNGLLVAKALWNLHDQRRYLPLAEVRPTADELWPSCGLLWGTS